MNLQAVLQAGAQVVKAVDPSWMRVFMEGGFALAALGLMLKGVRVVIRIEENMKVHAGHDNTRFAEVKERFEGVDRRHDGLRHVVEEIGTKITSLTDAIVGRVQDIVGRIEMKVEDQGKRIDGVLMKKGRT